MITWCPNFLGGMKMSRDIAFSKGSFVVGIKQTLRALEKNQLQRVYVAKDVDLKLFVTLRESCEKNAVPMEEIETSVLLGKLCRIAVKASAAGILI